MKLRVKTLRNEEVEIDVSDGEAVKRIKELIHEKFPQIPPNRQKLVWAGKILLDDHTLSEYPMIREGERLVVMTIKTPPKYEPKAEINQTISIAENVTQSIAAVQAPHTINYENSASLLVSGNQLEDTIQSICSMGFERSAVQQALRAAFNNPDRAVEYLINAPQPPIEQVPNATQIPIQVPNPDNQPQDTTTNTNSGSALGALRDSNVLHNLSLIIENDPQALPEYLSALGRTNPELLQLMAQNQGQLAHLLAQSSPTENNPNNPDTPAITLTETQSEAVARLQALGFSRLAALEAYLACERDEEVAANYLFENGNEYMNNDD